MNNATTDTRRQKHREYFIKALAQLLQGAELDVTALRYIPRTEGDHINPPREETVEITFVGGGKRAVGIEADSLAAIIKDVIRACE